MAEVADIPAALAEFHATVRPALASFAREAAEESEFTSWMDAWTDADNDARRLDDDPVRLAARRYAHGLATRTIHGAINADDAVREDPLASLPADPLDSLGGGALDESADGEPGREPFAEAFEDVPRDGTVEAAVAELVDAVDRRGPIDGNVLGDRYEDLLPAAARKADGQYYTPPTIAEAVVRWALPDDGRESASGALPLVLDPAAGGGTFAVAAYRRLADLAPDSGHQERLDHVVAVDVNREPLQSTTVALAGQAPAPAERVHAYEASFLDLDPDSFELDRLPGGGHGTNGAANEVAFDAVVGNPPYVRQEAIDKDHFRRHLETFNAESAEAVSAKSDAYVYFVTQATRFLREGGRLGFVVPTKWLMTDYGRSFQRFLFEHYRLHAVVGFGASAFDDALVDAALLLLERCSDADRRAGTDSRFVRLDGSVGVDAVLAAVSADGARPDHDDVTVESRHTGRTIALRQSTAADARAGKLSPYLSAPPAAIRLLQRSDLVRLGDLASVAYGNKTGANEFFFLDEADLAEWPIDDRFLAPALRSVRGRDSSLLTETATDQYLLDVRSYVDEFRDAGDRTNGDGSLVDRVRRGLRRDGYDALHSYVEHGERGGYHERHTCAAREVWFDLGPLERPAIVHPKFFDRRIVPLYNRDRLAPSNAVDGLSLRDGVDELVVFGLLHSTVHEVFLECWGRAEGGGALQLMTYEMETLPVVDPSTIQGEQRAALVDAVRRLLDGEDVQRDLDAVVLDAMGTDVTPEELREVRETLVGRRRREDDDAVEPIEPCEGT